MPWKPGYSEAEARAAISGAKTWAEALRVLGYGYHGKNIRTLRKWAARWEIPTDHLPAGTANRHPYTEADARAAIAASFSWAEALRRLGYCSSGANPRVLKRRAAEWGISTEHFDPYARARSGREPLPLDEILVEGSTYSRGNLKRRLYEEGLKEPRCELCGQDEIWCGVRIGLILDHINGIADDNRFENLRIVCPNCAATLDTHCGRKNRLEPLRCARCEKEFMPRSSNQRYCSRYCGSRWDRRGIKLPGARKVDRPSNAELLADVLANGYRAVGRKHGVSDNAVRKWLREYERDRAISEGRDPELVVIPRRTRPKQRRNGDGV